MNDDPTLFERTIWLAPKGSQARQWAEFEVRRRQLVALVRSEYVEPMLDRILLVIEGVKSDD